MKLSDLPVVLLEQKSLSVQRKQTANVGLIAKARLLAFKAYRDEPSFERGLREALGKLIAMDDESPKLMVVSAHGKPLTGTHLESDTGDVINWHFFESHFKVLPKHLIVFLSACFGAYPSSLAWQAKSDNKPILVGPMVNIQMKHANEFQDALLNAMCASADLESSIQAAVDHFNKRHFQYYQERTVLRLIRSNGVCHPRMDGTQLAADGYDKKRFYIRGFKHVTQENLLLDSGPEDANLLWDGWREVLAGISEVSHLDDREVRDLPKKSFDVPFQEKPRTFRNLAIPLILALRQVRPK